MKIYCWNELQEDQKKRVFFRPVSVDSSGVFKTVQNIVNQVKLLGDEAIFSLTRQYDGAELKALQVTEKEFENARTQVSQEVKEAIEFAKTQLVANHEQQLLPSKAIEISEGVYYERQLRAIERVGLYIPGGSAPLVSTILMLGVPAQIANCPKRVLCTPPNINGEIASSFLFAAEICGVKEIYKVGGAQAVAAMAYGTETIPKVDKIFGPGNAWVTQAKMLVAQDVQGAAIDMPAGPSELMIIAEDDANADYVAADLLSQAEHGIDSQVMLITFSEPFALEVTACLNRQLKALPRCNIAEQSLAHSRIIVVDNMQQALEISNEYAPEHLMLQVDNPQQYMPFIKNAGTVFLGEWAPETFGDYVTGSNHVLPTFGYTRSYSGLSTLDFMKYISFQRITRKGFENLAPYAEELAKLEGLQGHANAVSIRRQKR